MEQADTKLLYSRLYSLRGEIAAEKNVPVYMVFPNKTLREMALYMPSSLTELSSIYGVGKTKLKQFGEVFVNEINRFRQEYNISAKFFPSEDRVIDVNVTATEEYNREITPIEVTYSGSSLTDIHITVPEKTAYSFAISNYDEIKESLKRILANYEQVAYTPGQLKQAKQDKATLTKLKKALATKSKELKDICLEPYYSVAEQFKELQRMIDAPLVKIADFTSAMDQLQKDSKSVEIKLFYDAHSSKLGVLAEPIYYSKWFYDKKWENKSTQDRVWQYQLLQKIETASGVITELSMNAGENGSAVIAKYVETGDEESAKRFLQSIISIQSRPISDVQEEDSPKGKASDNPPEEKNNSEGQFAESLSVPEKHMKVMIKIIGTKQQFEAVLRYIDQIGADYQVYVTD